MDRNLILSYKESEKGQILHEGISESGAMGSVIAAGSSYATHGTHMIPVYVFYSMFGWQRTGDEMWLFGDQLGRGFLLGATAGRTTLTGMIGGATDPEIVEKRDEEILAVVLEEASRILAITGQPIVSRVWKHPKALPQYNLGHGHTVEMIRESERGIPGLYFAGNYLEGPSIGKCVDRGSQVAESARAYLRDAMAKSA